MFFLRFGKMENTSLPGEFFYNHILHHKVTLVKGYKRKLHHSTHRGRWRYPFLYNLFGQGFLGVTLRGVSPRVLAVWQRATFMVALSASVWVLCSTPSMSLDELKNPFTKVSVNTFITYLRSMTSLLYTSLLGCARLGICSIIGFIDH